MGIEMEKSDLFNLYLRGRWNRRVLGIIVFAGVVTFFDRYDFYDPSLSSYGNRSALTGWDNRSDFFFITENFRKLHK